MEAGELLFLLKGLCLKGTSNASGGSNKAILSSNYREDDLVVIGHWMKIRLRVLLTITPLSQD